jgi:hypothetical protein
MGMYDDLYPHIAERAAPVDGGSGARSSLACLRRKVSI